MKNKSTHTPGPWLASASSVKDTKQNTICHIAPLVGHDVCGDREISNARIIAAAPELLEALKLLKAELYEHHLLDARKRFNLCAADAQAASAIAKAQGK